MDASFLLIVVSVFIQGSKTEKPSHMTLRFYKMRRRRRKKRQQASRYVRSRAALHHTRDGCWIGGKVASDWPAVKGAAADRVNIVYVCVHACYIGTYRDSFLPAACRSDRRPACTRQSCSGPAAPAEIEWEFHVSLRLERIYVITRKCMDAAGNVSAFRHPDNGWLLGSVQVFACNWIPKYK